MNIPPLYPAQGTPNYIPIMLINNINMQNQSKCCRKVRFIFFPVLLFLLMIASCFCHPAVTKQISTIVIITKNAPESKDYSFSFTTMHVANEGNIVYVDTSLNLIHYKLKAVPYDTIMIYSNHDNLEIRHDYSAFDCVYYLLNRGDTLFLSYTNKNIPYAKILNRHYNENELNYDYQLAKQFPQPDTLSFRGAVSYYSLMSSGNNEYIPKKEEANKNLHNLLNNQLAYLDSLQKNGFISEAHYLYRKNNILSAIFLNHLDSTADNSFFLSDSLFLKYDFLIYFDYYRKLINDRMSISLVYNSQIPYSQVFFNEIVHSQKYSNQIKKYVFRLLSRDLREEVFTEDLEKLLLDYQTITGDSVTYNDLKEQFGLLRPDSLGISLKSTDGKRITFNQLLEKHKGSYVYIDFWATWCIPCRILLGENVKLEKEYHNKNIVFITLAFYDDEERWLSYLSKNPDKFGTENFYITNTKSSRIIEGWNIKTVPRYMLFDKKGEAALLDAPRPNTSEIRAIFNRLLK